MASRTPFVSSIASSAHLPISGGGETTRGRLIAAAAALVADGGIAAASARAVAAEAGASASAINYNLGGIERLLLSVFERGVAETQAWLEPRAKEIAALPPNADGAGLALLHVLSAWTGEGRRLALLYQEALAAGAGEGAAGAWTRLWRDFWLNAAQALGLAPADGRLLHVLFEFEALHNLSTWSPALQAGALGEIVERFAAICLGAPSRAPRGALILAEQAAGTRAYGSLAPAAMRIAKAAAEVVEDKGFSGLTHRAVAARAGVTTGSVTHHFRSIEDLVAGAIRGQVQAMTEEASAEDEAPGSIEDVSTAEQLFEMLRFHTVGERPPNPVLRRRRLFLAAVRREDLAGAAAVIRYSYGGTTREALGRIFGLSGQALVLEASVLSRLLSSAWFACSGDADAGVARGEVMDEIERRFAAWLADGAALRD